MLRLYDTRSRQLEAIVPANARVLRMYTCGPTVYRYAHVGNLRSYLLSDLIRRVLEQSRVRSVVCQNITDVGHLVDDEEIDASGEDKVLQQARREGRSAMEIARFYEDAFRRDTSALNMRTPEHTPRATETIDLMIELIAKLIEKGHAYAVDDGSVFFDARSFPTYGEISGNRLDALKPGHRVEGVDPRKRFHADWALWKGSDREMTWETPWGRGSPAGTSSARPCPCASSASTSTSTPAARTCASPTMRTSAPSRTPRSGTTSSSTGSTASTCCSTAARWPSPPATSCSCPTSWPPGSTPLPCVWRCSNTATASR